MKKICAILLIGLLCCGLCACGEEAPVPADEGTKVYEDLTEPAVDVKITDAMDYDLVGETVL